MKENKTDSPSTEKRRVFYHKPEACVKEWDLSLSGRSVRVQAEMDWLLIRKKEKPVADMFYTYYRRLDLKSRASSKRPLTFVFNGGPGASSVFLHIGAFGPKKAAFGERGQILPPPVQLQDNPESLIDKTDLVFIDPVGCGFSRAFDELDFSSPEEVSNSSAPTKPKPKKDFYKLEKDLQSLAEFIQLFLSRYRRWSSPLFLAGESYGGFRAARLSSKLYIEYGIALNGVIILSPCLELKAFSSDDYDVLYWMDVFPSMAAAAAYHKKSTYFAGRDILKNPLSDFLRPAEDFATQELVSVLVQGERQKKREDILKKAQAFSGIPFETLKLAGGRLSMFQFLRQLLKEEGKWCGMYDAAQTIWDPFPHRIRFEGPDPTYHGYEPSFTQGIQCLFKEFMGLKCERKYRILNEEVNKSWQSDKKSHFFDINIGSADDLKSALALNPHLKVLLCHGVFDMVTPYFSSQRTLSLMRLKEDLKKQILFRLFYGGHMFYTWRDSLREFKKCSEALFSESVTGGQAQKG